MSSHVVVPSDEEIQAKIDEMTMRLNSTAESKEKQLFRKYRGFISEMRAKKHSYAAITLVLEEVANFKISAATLKKWLLDTGGETQNEPNTKSPVTNAIEKGLAMHRST
jgi:hypothetical protein